MARHGKPGAVPRRPEDQQAAGLGDHAAEAEDALLLQVLVLQVAFKIFCVCWQMYTMKDAHVDIRKNILQTCVFVDIVAGFHEG